MSLLTILLFILMMFAGSFFCATYFNKKFEETLPISNVCIILISFIFGILGLLKISVYILLIICLILYALSIYRIIKDKSIKEVVTNIFTPGFVLFMVLTIMVFISIYGKLFDATDEYSHWGDIVKVMTSLDDFGSNPNSNSLFKSYPPGVSLFQYVIQKINYILTGDLFSEWLCYFAYDLLGISFFMPICINFSFKKPISLICFVLIIFMIPLEFYTYAYHGLYVDQLLAYLVGVGSIYLLWHKDDDILFDLTILSIIVMLVLTKDAGLAFATMIAIAFIIEKIVNSKEKFISKKNIIVYIETLLAIAIPKLLWSINIKLNKAQVSFDNKFDFKNLILVLLGKDDSYRRKVLTTFVEKFTTLGINLGETNIFINYFALLIVSIIGIIIVCKYANKYTDKSNCMISKYYLIVNTLIFIVGTCISYMYKFSQEEALMLASFDRYLAICFLSIWLFIVISILLIANINEKKFDLICYVLICFIVINTPMEASVSLLTNSYAKNSRVERSMYSELENKVLQECDHSRILFIYSDANDRDLLAFRYLLRPNTIDSYWQYNQDSEELEYDHNSMNVSQLENMLSPEEIDYVVIYDLNDGFIGNYGEIFESISDINKNSVYRLNENNKLVLYN